MSTYFIFELLRLPQTKECIPLLIKNERCFRFLQRYTHKLLAGILPSMQGEQEVFFSLPPSPMNVDPGFNYPNFNYSMKLAVLGVQHTIERSCASTSLVIPTQWSIPFCYMQVAFRRVQHVYVYPQHNIMYQHMQSIWKYQFNVLCLMILVTA